MKKSAIFSVMMSVIATLMVLFLSGVRNVISDHVAKTYEFSFLKLATAYVFVIFVLLFADIIISHRSAGVHQFIFKPVLAVAILVYFIVNYQAVMYGRDMYIYVIAMCCFATGAIMGLIEKLNIKTK